MAKGSWIVKLNKGGIQFTIKDVFNVAVSGETLLFVDQTNHTVAAVPVSEVRFAASEAAFGKESATSEK